MTKQSEKSTFRQWKFGSCEEWTEKKGNSWYSKQLKKDEEQNQRRSFRVFRQFEDKDIVAIVRKSKYKTVKQPGWEEVRRCFWAQERKRHIKHITTFGRKLTLFSAIPLSRFSLQMSRFFCVFRAGKNALYALCSASNGTQTTGQPCSFQCSAMLIPSAKL